MQDTSIALDTVRLHSLKFSQSRRNELLFKFTAKSDESREDCNILSDMRNEQCNCSAVPLQENTHHSDTFFPSFLLLFFFFLEPLRVSPQGEREVKKKEQGTPPPFGRAVREIESAGCGWVSAVVFRLFRSFPEKLLAVGVWVSSLQCAVSRDRVVGFENVRDIRYVCTFEHSCPFRRHFFVGHVLHREC
ncbi:uncharacterized protein KNAG_0D04060 [Huiozyma naganishii CBS 8797]|uniref:Uncharacterized protein n=1 Tax=Huiozyma naganishii (strain ATCC MYA-139 / BCRC 22969 / CBS 8797 / KCTC 17520 / NBRC 10181 / NCYC 3082 / Yp74L-3) TaxID=1071383 RepID=J7RYC9_HUIN7|nr:hypothetical protein KNAG_0D04060 [Kazachstania naganishii CBS 8797]CCK70152.1 hypothetical protein KNAG_0D04060 [Kazachstania naganishii CBS 8797]